MLVRVIHVKIPNYLTLSFLEQSELVMALTLRCTQISFSKLKTKTSVLKHALFRTRFLATLVIWGLTLPDLFLLMVWRSLSVLMIMDSFAPQVSHLTISKLIFAGTSVYWTSNNYASTRLSLLLSVILTRRPSPISLITSGRSSSLMSVVNTDPDSLTPFSPYQCRE